MSPTKTHGAVPARPNVRSKRIAGSVTQTKSVIDGCRVSACACSVPKRYPAYGSGTPYRAAFATIAASVTAAVAIAMRARPVGLSRQKSSGSSTTAGTASRGVRKSVSARVAAAIAGRRAAAVNPMRNAVATTAAPTTFG